MDLHYIAYVSPSVCIQYYEDGQQSPVLTCANVQLHITDLHGMLLIQ